MERPDFFTLKNGEKVKLPFSDNEYDERVNKLRRIMDKNNLNKNKLKKSDKIEIVHFIGGG